MTKLWLRLPAVQRSWLACDTVVTVDPEPSDLQRESLHFYIYSTTAWINGPSASSLLNHGKPSSTGKQGEHVWVCVCNCWCVSKEEELFKIEECYLWPTSSLFALQEVKGILSVSMEMSRQVWNEKWVIKAKHWCSDSTSWETISSLYISLTPV